MKSVKTILKTLFIFLSFIFTLALIPHSENFSDAQYLSNDYQKVVLVANSIYGGEIVANRDNNSSNSSLNIHQIDNTFFSNDEVFMTPDRGTRDFIHNLSTNLENEISVRAP